MELKSAVIAWLLDKDKADYHQGVMLMMKAGIGVFGLNQESSENKTRIRRALQEKLRKNDLNGIVRTESVKKQELIIMPDEDDTPGMVEIETDALLQIDKRNLYNERRKLSNAFHDCNSDSERKRVYDKIMAVERAYQEQLRKINYFKKTGEHLEDKKQEIESAYPDDPVQLLMLRNNLRANRSKKLKIMEMFPKNHPKNIKAHHQYADVCKKLEEVEALINKR